MSAAQRGAVLPLFLSAAARHRLLSIGRRHGAGAALLGGATVAAMAGQLALTKVIATGVSVADFGVFQLLLSIAWLLQTCTFGPLAVAALRLAGEAAEHGWLRDLLRAMLVLCLAVTGGAVVLASLPWRGLFLLSHDIPVWLGIGGVVYGCLAGFTTILISVMQGLLLNRSVALALLAQSWLQVAALLLGRVLGLATLGDSLVLICATLALVGAGQGLLLARQLKARPAGAGSAPTGRRAIRETLRFCLPFALWAPFSYVTDFGDRWALARFATLSDIGSYGVLAVLTTRIVAAVATVLGRIVNPHIFAVAGNASDAARVRRALRLVAWANLALLAAALPLMAAYYFAPRLLIKALASAAYEAGAGDLWLLGAAAILFNLGQVLALPGLMLKRTWAYLPAKILAAALLVRLLWIETPVAGIHGVAMSLVASNAFQLALMVLANAYLWFRYIRRMA